MKINVNGKIMIGLSNIESLILDDVARDNIKFLIQERKLSQRKIAELSNGTISYAFVAHLLSGRKNVISKDKFFKICQILDVEPEQIFRNSVKLYSNSH
ncbi:helix-turn-helix domain-containing protein [Cyanobacterium sp. HL-69]|nr:helix-turn-helix transcriptional regulator [Cyanobacterium sp. IPPAS B-1200]